MMKENYYSVLGVSCSATTTELKEAYRSLALRYHPDRNRGSEEAEERFKRVSEAYLVLKEPDSRTVYDYGLSEKSREGSASGKKTKKKFKPSAEAFDQLFKEVFSGIHSGQSEKRGGDIRIRHHLSFSQAALGTELTLQFRRNETCPGCWGSGCKTGTTSHTCARCGGSGSEKAYVGKKKVQRLCPVCRGSGSTITSSCGKCNGEGVVKRTMRLPVSVPVGIEAGATMKLEGEGHVGSGKAPAGDLFIQFSVGEHECFTRKGNDIYYDLPVSFPLLALGGELNVPTLTGEVKVTIPEGTQSHQVFRLKGKGIAGLRGGAKRGDQIVRVIARTPYPLSKEQQELLKKFKELTLKVSQPTAGGMGTS